MRVPPALRVLPVLAGLLVLLIVPAAKAAETLVLTCTKCDEVIATGKGLPANETVRVSMTDVRSGQQVVNNVSVTTDADGNFVKAIPLDLTKHPSLESSVWKSDGNVLVIAAHDRFTAPCKPAAASLPLTGSQTWLLLGAGLGLLVIGGGLLVSGRYRGMHAA
jgi:LPXTG-motif cell wall-anchored protein